MDGKRPKKAATKRRLTPLPRSCRFAVSQTRQDKTEKTAALLPSNLISSLRAKSHSRFLIAFLHFTLSLWQILGIHRSFLPAQNFPRKRIDGPATLARGTRRSNPRARTSASQRTPVRIRRQRTRSDRTAIDEQTQTPSKNRFSRNAIEDLVRAVLEVLEASCAGVGSACGL